MASRDINDCDSRLIKIYYDFQAEMKKAGLAFILTCTARSMQEQAALFAQGRESTIDVNDLRRKAGLDLLPMVDSKGNAIIYKPITWTMQSYHIVDKANINPFMWKSRAFDIALVYPNNPKKVYYDLKVDVDNDKLPDYREAANIGIKVGLTVGYDFKQSDPPHYQLKV